MQNRKFIRLLHDRFPILFIDEYQDAAKAIATSIVTNLIAEDDGPLIGLFGDSWQKIYDHGCGLIEHENLTVIDKRANFRSDRTIVEALNRIRPELPQEVNDPQSAGTILVYHSNEWAGNRRKGGHWEGDLPADDAHRCLVQTRALLADAGWDFSPSKTKILILTHNILAAEQEYAGIAGVFKYNESYTKKEDPHIGFFVDTLEPLCLAYREKRYGAMFDVLQARTPAIRTRGDKLRWTKALDPLLALREAGTIGDVLDHLKASKQPRLPDVISAIQAKLATAAADEEVAESREFSEAKKLRAVPYRQIIALARFLGDFSPFETNHGVKGAEFDNVLIVLGRGWGRYNWNQFLEWCAGNVPADKMDAYERNRNLFYVVCSRPKKRLALLFTQRLSATGLRILADWFGPSAVCSLSF